MCAGSGGRASFGVGGGGIPCGGGGGGIIRIDGGGMPIIWMFLCYDIIHTYIFLKSQFRNVRNVQYVQYVSLCLYTMISNFQYLVLVYKWFLIISNV